MKKKKGLISLGLAFVMLLSGCASESENPQNLDTDSQTDQTAQTVYTEEATVQTDNAPITENTSGSDITTLSEESTAAVTASVTEAATVAATAATASIVKHTTTTTKAPIPTTTTTTITDFTTTTAKVTTEVTTEEKNKPVVVEYNNNLTTAQIVNNMGVGINLGNTFEACGDWINKNGGVKAYETAWGSPVITKEMIEGYAKCGFGVLRIPVAWSNLMGDNYTISKELMDRVKQVTQWTVDSGMYAIVNIHWDSGWWEKFPSDKENCMKKYIRIWEQISEGFKNFDGRVMFESLNEEGCWNDVWNRYSGGTNGKSDAYGLLNEINQKFVDIVRSSGGNNKIRHLLIAGYATDIDLTCDKLFKMPNDPKNRCALSIHYYTPATFCILEKDESWGKAKTTWGSDRDKKELAKYMDMLKTNYVDKGIPVIMGEYGVAKGNKTAEVVRLFISSVAKAAKDRNICPVLWDTPNNFYDRNHCRFYDEELLKGIIAAVN